MRQLIIAIISFFALDPSWNGGEVALSIPQKNLEAVNIALQSDGAKNKVVG